MRFDQTIVIESRDEQRKSLGSWNAPRTSLVCLEFRVIDCRPAMPLDETDADWGEHDSLASVPRRKQEPFVRALTMEPGDA